MSSTLCDSYWHSEIVALNATVATGPEPNVAGDLM